MKIKFLVIIALFSTLLFCACGQFPDPIIPTKDSEISTEITDETVTHNMEDTKVDFPSEDLAVQCMQAVVTADVAQDVAPWITENSQNKAQSLANYYPGAYYTVRMKHVATAGNYDIFSYYLEEAVEGGQKEESYCLLYRAGDRYQLCAHEQTQQDITNRFLCALCGGSGSIRTGNPIACGICSGTGWQYIPNAYYDAGTNMWMGQHIGCGGCGGSGWTGTYTTITCAGCHGIGYNFS